MATNKVKAAEITGNDIILTTDLDDIGDMARLRDAVLQLWPDKRFIIVQKGKLDLLQESEMNRLGWYRKEGKHE